MQVVDGQALLVEELASGVQTARGPAQNGESVLRSFSFQTSLEGTPSSHRELEK